MTIVRIEDAVVMTETCDILVKVWIWMLNTSSVGLKGHWLCGKAEHIFPVAKCWRGGVGPCVCCAVISSDLDSRGNVKQPLKIRKAITSELVRLGMLPAVLSLARVSPPDYLTVQLDGRILGHMPTVDISDAIARLRLLKASRSSEASKFLLHVSYQNCVFWSILWTPSNWPPKRSPKSTKIVVLLLHCELVVFRDCCVLVLKYIFVFVCGLPELETNFGCCFHWQLLSLGCFLRFLLTWKRRMYRARLGERTQECIYSQHPGGFCALSNN